MKQIGLQCDSKHIDGKDIWYLYCCFNMEGQIRFKVYENLTKEELKIKVFDLLIKNELFIISMDTFNLNAILIEELKDYINENKLNTNFLTDQIHFILSNNLLISQVPFIEKDRFEISGEGKLRLDVSPMSIRELNFYRAFLNACKLKKTINTKETE